MPKDVAYLAKAGVNKAQVDSGLATALSGGSVDLSVSDLGLMSMNSQRLKRFCSLRSLIGSSEWTYDMD